MFQSTEVSLFRSKFLYSTQQFPCVGLVTAGLSCCLPMHIGHFAFKNAEPKSASACKADAMPMLVVLELASIYPTFGQMYRHINFLQAKLIKRSDNGLGGACRSSFDFEDTNRVANDADVVLFFLVLPKWLSSQVKCFHWTKTKPRELDVRCTKKQNKNPNGRLDFSSFL